jgi:hypothetical protein
MSEYLPFNPKMAWQHPQMQFFLDQVALNFLTRLSEKEIKKKHEQIIELLERVIQRQTSLWIAAGIPEGLIKVSVNEAILKKRKQRLAKYVQSGQKEVTT